MQMTIALLRAEALKLRRTRFVWLVVGIPGIALVLHMMLIFDRSSFYLANPDTLWRRSLNDGWGFWLAFTLPLFISLAVAVLLNLEHRGNQWKQLFAWPIPRWSAYATKLVFGLLFIGLACLVYALGMIGNVLFVGAVERLVPDAPIPWLDLFTAAARAIIATAPAVAIQTWVSARFKGFAAPLGIGLGAVVMGLMLMSLRSRKLIAFYPWTLPLATMDTRDPAIDTSVPVWIGAIGGLVIGAFVCWDLARRRDVE